MLVSTFRVYVPTRRKAYRGTGFWTVHIFDTPASLRAYIGSCDLPGGAYRRGKDALGFCRALTRRHRLGGYRPVKRGQRGLVLLNLQTLGVRVASHEFTHAAHYELASHQGREPLTLKDDEALAHLVGDLHAKFWTLFYKRFSPTNKFRRGWPVWKAVAA